MQSPNSSQRLTCRQGKACFRTRPSPYIPAPITKDHELPEVSDKPTLSFCLSMCLCVYRSIRPFPRRAPGDALMDLIGEILTTEPLVANMMAVEALDVLSVEGAGVAFQKLVSLCGGSE